MLNVIQPNQIHPSRLWGSTRPRWTAEFASTSLWGRYAAATIQCPKNQIQTYFRMFLEERKITLLPAFLDTTVYTMVQWKLYARDHIRTMKKGALKKGFHSVKVTHKNYKFRSLDKSPPEVS